MLENNTIKVLKFGASWCGPCTTMEPIIKKVISEIKDINLISIDVDKEPDTAREYGIKSIPALVLLDNENKIIKSLIGSASTDQIKKFLSKKQNTV
jgi:thioredoxin 1